MCVRLLYYVFTATVICGLGFRHSIVLYIYPAPLKIVLVFSLMFMCLFLFLFFDPLFLFKYSTAFFLFSYSFYVSCGGFFYHVKYI